jgi:rhodanese-related sulfurtransferase
VSSDNPIIIVSSNGHRGAIAMMALQLIGYQDVTNLEGGTDALAAQLAQANLSDSLARALAATAGEPLLTPEAARQALAAGDVTLVDVRPAEAYAAGFIDGALNVPLASLVDNLAALGDPAGRLIVVDGTGYHAAIAATALRVLGYTSATGLSGGVQAWEAAGLPLVTSPVPQLPAGTAPKVDPKIRDTVTTFLAGVQAEAWTAVEPGMLADMAPDSRPPLIDLRQADAYAGGHIEGAINIPLDKLVSSLDRLPAAGPVILVDETGYHSAAAQAALQLLGYTDVRLVAGGMEGWRAEELPEAAVLFELALGPVRAAVPES